MEGFLEEEGLAWALIAVEKGHPPWLSSAFLWLTCNCWLCNWLVRGHYNC